MSTYNLPVFRTPGVGGSEYRGGGSEVFSAEVTATLAQVNAGYQFVADDPAGRQIKPVGIFVSFAGTWAACTDIRIGDTAGTPVVVGTVAVANADDDKWNEGDAELVLGAGWLTALTAGKGLQIYKTGDPATGGTSATVRVLFRLI